jgi:hypothetical protein
VGRSPFELLYGRQPGYFGITTYDKISSIDVKEWLHERSLIIAYALENEDHADKHRRKRNFEVGT